MKDTFSGTEMPAPDCCSIDNMTDLYLYFRYFVNILKVIAKKNPKNLLGIPEIQNQVRFYKALYLNSAPAVLRQWSILSLIQNILQRYSYGLA